MEQRQGIAGSTECNKTGGQNVTAKAGRHICCPVCDFRQSYRLSDGRRQCKRCRKKFTHKSRRTRLPKETIKEIVRLFWLTVPAERVAKDLGINRLTALKHYTQLRQGIAEQREQELLRMSGEVEVDESYFGGVRKGKRGRGAGGKVPVFGLLKRNGEVRVVFPERVDRETLHGAVKVHVQPDSWVYSDGLNVYDKLDLEGFHHARICHNETFGEGAIHINGIENFWGFAKRRLKMYHGGYKKNFRLFMREMEFRFNYRNNETVLQYLYKLLKSGPTN